MFINDFSFICALGNNKDKCSNMLSNGIRPKFTLFDMAGVMRPVAQIDDTILPRLKTELFESRINRISNAALCSLDDSIKNAVNIFGANRIGIFIGSCDNGSEASYNALLSLKNSSKFPKDYSLEFQKAEFPLEFIAKRYGIQGVKILHSTACASSASAFISARNHLLAKNCDAAIVGGVDIASKCAMLGFSALEAISDTPTMPFSNNRSGITLGEGAAYFLITREKTDVLTSDYCKGLQIAGIGESADAYHMTSPRQDGEGAYIAMQNALKDAHILPHDIGYINAHGTGTLLNDAMEAKAIQSLFGENVPVSSTKAFTGHTLGAAGALNVAFCCMALQNGKLPALPQNSLQKENTNSQEYPLPKIRLAKRHEIINGMRYSLSNAFAFGGLNVSIVLKKD